MKFIVEDAVFDLLPTVFFGVVVGRGINNSGSNGQITVMLEEAMQSTKDKFALIKPKEHPDLQPYRRAFEKLGINPNRFPCSVEALSARIAKGGSLPAINPVVNLVNSYSLNYTLPMGAHDLDATESDIMVRFSQAGDLFIPFGGGEPEVPDSGELVYASGSTIKTRKWIWRQSEVGKVTENSCNIFFPIDGFADYNRDAVVEACNGLAADLEEILGGNVTKYFVDKDSRSILLN
jgi:DNA/RNA-binding domain of Phe-tRNA-synthetase-like protein